MIEHETDAPVTVIAEYQAHAGRGDEVAMILARHVTATRAEPGCANFTAYRDPEDPEHFALYEEYTDENAFQAHRKTTHFVAFVEEQIAPLLLDRRWRRYHEVPAVGSTVADS
jgi:quinol monooxygenase YgiN